MARPTHTDITWVGSIKRSGKALSLEMARSILACINERVDRITNTLKKGAFEEVAEELKVGKQTVQGVYYETRRALKAEYKSLEDYWAAGRPFKQNKNPQQVGAGK